MEFRDISGVLRENQLNNCNLDILFPDHNNYQALIYQHKGEVDVDCQNHMFIRNHDRDLAKNKFNQFLQLAIEKNVEIAISPEYSCPWDSINNAARNNIFPELGKIWILGCESIKPNEFREFSNLNYENLILIYDPDLVMSMENKFLDPACFLFKTTRSDTNQEVNVIVIQFKNFPMGGNPCEQDSMILGNYGYKFRNDGGSINMICLICADVLNLRHADLDRLDLDQAFIFLHIQLNNNRADNYEWYKAYLLGNDREDASNKDIIALNWARNSKINRTVMEYGGSAYYMKSTKVNDEDHRISNNDSKGAFYSYWSNARVNTYFFDYDEFIFHISLEKASKRMAPVQSRMKRGPEMFNRYKWNKESIRWEVFDITKCDLRKFCESEDELDFSPLIDLSSINKERLVSLVNGNVPNELWYKPRNHFHFQIDNSLVNNRIVFHHDPNKDALLKKHTWILRFGELVTNIKTNSENFPKERFLDIRDNCELFYEPISNNPISYLINAQDSRTNGIKATLIYIGESTESYAIQVLNWVCDIVGDSHHRLRVLVWYINNGLKYKFLNEGGDPEITDITSTSNISFKRTKE